MMEILMKFQVKDRKHGDELVQHLQEVLEEKCQESNSSKKGNIK